MKRFDLLKDADGKLWLINCTLRKTKLEVGLAIFFSGLPASVPVISESNDPIATLVMPNLERMKTSATEADIAFNLFEEELTS